MLQKYSALANQTIFDVCLMTYGTLDLLADGESALYKLIQDNNFGSVNNYPYAGQVFTWDDTYIFNEVSYLTNLNTGTSYATKSSGVGNISYNISDGGAPASNAGYPITPTPPNTGADSKYDYYIVYNTDSRWQSGTNTFTDPYLKGKSGYAVYAQQNSQFFSVTEGVDLHYDSIAGSFTVLVPGFYIINQYYLVVYPNKYDTSIP